MTNAVLTDLLFRWSHDVQNTFMWFYQNFLELIVCVEGYSISITVIYDGIILSDGPVYPGFGKLYAGVDLR